MFLFRVETVLVYQINTNKFLYKIRNNSTRFHVKFQTIFPKPSGACGAKKKQDEKAITHAKHDFGFFVTKFHIFVWHSDHSNDHLMLWS